MARLVGHITRKLQWNRPTDRIEWERPGLISASYDVTIGTVGNCLLSHSGHPASDFSTFPLASNIIYIPSLGVKAQSDTHYSSEKIIRFSWRITEGFHS